MSIERQTKKKLKREKERDEEKTDYENLVNILGNMDFILFMLREHRIIYFAQAQCYACG